MLVIGELINGMYKQVAEAIKTQDEQIIQQLAKEQVEAGANALDVNTGPSTEDPLGAMRWLVETIQRVVDVPLALDSTKPKVIEEGLKIVTQRAIINSTTAEEEKLDTILSLALTYNAQIIGLTMDKRGIPRDRVQRSELALKIVSTCMEKGIDLSDLYIDPVVLPVNVAQAQQIEILEAIREFSLLSDPPPKTVVGLSNVSQGAKDRNLINRTFLIMAINNGLSAAILDPLDKELMKALITAELILNRHIYCDSYLEAYVRK